LRQLPHSRITVALIYNLKGEALQEEVSQNSPSPSLSPDLSPPEASQVNSVVSPGQNEPGRVGDLYAEWDSPETINAIRAAIELRHEVLPVEADERAMQKLLENRPDFAFNMAEGLYGVSREAHMPAILEMLQIPYLGSDPLTLGLCLDKARTKEILSYHRIPTAPFTVVRSQEEFEDARVRFPAIVKPLHEGSSKGITNSSVARTTSDLQREVTRVLTTYRQPALIEEFLPGREFTVAVLGNGEKARCLPVVEINYEVFPAGVNPIYGYEAKWIWDTPENPLDIFTCPAVLDPRLKEQIETICLKAFHVLSCRDWARIDLRLDARGEPKIIEVNPLPGVLPKPEENSCFPKAARAAGMQYDELILAVLDVALERVGLLKPVKERAEVVPA
jgi:D-alanine-D-alanine ligase